MFWREIDTCRDRNIQCIKQILDTEMLDVFSNLWFLDSIQINGIMKVEVQLSGGTKGQKRNQ